MKYEDLSKEDKAYVDKQMVRTSKIHKLFRIIDSFSDEENEEKLEEVMDHIHLHIDFNEAKRIWHIYAPGDICFIVIREWLCNGDEGYRYLGEIEPFPKTELDEALKLAEKVKKEVFEN